LAHLTAPTLRFFFLMIRVYPCFLRAVSRLVGLFTCLSSSLYIP
jgi:hypothetical protein